MWYHSSAPLSFGFHYAVLFESFCLNRFSYLHWDSFLLLLTCRHCLGSLLCPLLILNNLSAALSVITLRTQSALETFVGQWESKNGLLRVKQTWIPGQANWETVGKSSNLVVSFYLNWVWHQPHKDAPCISASRCTAVPFSSLSVHMLCLHSVGLCPASI